MIPVNHTNPLILFISILLQLFSTALGVYYIFISIFAWVKKRDMGVEGNKLHTFALIIAAHNEDAVIRCMVESLQKLKYPRECFDIFVIADNCTDNTATVAREAGAIVYERFNNSAKGKGHALEWMFKRLFNLERKYDSICIFDADNVVSSNFLSEINTQHNKGYKVVQGNIDSKNPYDSWISCAYSISFWSIGRLFQMARNNINLSCQLSGTGFSMNCELLKELGWGATCLTEDMEFTAKLILNGEKVGWAHNAVVFDEKPLYLGQSWKQRKRWMQGHADVASRFCIKLFKKAFKDKDMSAFDCAIYLMQPFKVLCLGVITVMAWAQTFFPDGNFGFFQMWYLFKNPIIWWLFISFDFIYIPLTVTHEKQAFNTKLLFGYLTYALYTLTWIPITIQGLIDKNKTEWSHTKHIRSIDISEIEHVKE